MVELAVSDFDAYFQAVHGHWPYPWQSRLTRRVIEDGSWPDVIDLPTGTGKTAVLDTAVFSLALRPEVSPRRIVFVIDRRIVVDQVYERARRIRDKVGEATDGVLAEVRRRLGELAAGEEGEPLGVAALRGGIPIDGEWARRPDQPWVMVSTVDQFGSRLLFRGYGVSHRMRPLHAGLVGNDCLVILDEVHLSRAFAATLRAGSSDGAIPQMRAVNADRLPRRFAVVEMSATPENESGRWFRLEQADLEQSSRLRQIASARKRATLVEVGGTRPPEKSVPGQVLRLIKKELSDDERSVGVIVNRVRTARETYAALRKANIAAHLVTGRMRPIDRQRVLDEISGAVDPERDSLLDQRTVVVATQSIEVGADFSFDALITEAAPADSLIQRIGRLDRRGSLARPDRPARCWILGVAAALNPKRPDFVYGDAARCAWEELRVLSDGGEIDAGPSDNLLAHLSTDARAPKLEAPLLLPSHVEAWSQTSPEPVVDPPIAEFLHGKERRHEPDVSVVWRLDLSVDALRLVPPRPAEFLSVPVAAFKNWVQGRVEIPVSDVDLVATSEERESQGRLEAASVRRLAQLIKWRGQGETEPRSVQHLDEIEPGDIIVVPCGWGGLSGGTWDPTGPPDRGSSDPEDDPGSQPVADLGDVAQQAYRQRATLRLDPRLLMSLPHPLSPAPSPGDEEDAEEDLETRILCWLDAIDEARDPEWLSEAAGRLRDASSRYIHLLQPDDGPHYYVLVERAVDASALDGFDEAASMTGTEVRLSDHLEGVGAKVAAYAQALGLPDKTAADLRLAAELHDLGKVDSRFQAQLHGHDPVRMAESATEGEPLAKSLPGVRPRPNSWPAIRHEFSSVALVESNPSLLDSAYDRDLVLHLVGTHHGYGRPLPTIRKDEQPQQLNAEHHGVTMSVWSDLAETPLALDMADRFWRLQLRYGHYGLAWLEAILRLADHQQSAQEAR